MKKSKKLLALALATMMAFSAMALPAAAYGGGVDPQGIVGLEDHNRVCPICGSALVYVNGEYICLAPHR